MQIRIEELTPKDFYIVRYKRHWWNRWRYIIDDRHNLPMLFHDTGAAIKAINELFSHSKKDNMIERMEQKLEGINKEVIK